MCSIAGILFKNGSRSSLPMTTGEALTEMMDACVHRGPDSAGWALYRDPHPGRLRLRFLVPQGTDHGEVVDRIKERLELEGAELMHEERLGCTYGVVVGFEGDLQRFSYAMEKAGMLLSAGSSLDIIKDVGRPLELCNTYRIAGFNGTHGIGHTRLATESGVHPETAHPFWATGFADVATVHNGQITNYWIMRRRLERHGMEFRTENDTELIAVYLAYRMSKGASLKEALRTSLEDLDGTFSYLVATADSIGYAKDKLAAKPMVKYEDDALIAIASEEVALNRLFPGKSLDTTEPPPHTFGLWSRSLSE
ncbi:MAG: amidophosphoribosyltransferase [Deltaproteobacteria bacterium]|nr:amidophosphoribosyltransferase [Deltaproteobacteria bacterium]